MAKGTTFAGSLLDHIFRNASIANIGDASGLQPSAAAGSFYLSLHTADPGAGGAQNTSECAYTGYARVAIARSSGGFGLTGAQLTNAADVLFGLCTAGSETATHFGLGTAASGAGVLLYKGPLASGVKLFYAEAAGDTLSVPGNAFVVDDRVVAEARPGVSLPTGLTEGTVYWVKTVSGEVITLSTTQGGSTLNLTSSGGGKIGLSKQLAISSGITPKVTASTLVLSEG